jgi:hypothetical protein
MKKLLSAFLVLVVFAIVGLMYSSNAYAAATNPDYAYVVVKCTVSLSIQVLATTNYVYLNNCNNGTNGISAGEAWVSSNVVVANNGSGCIETWTLQVTTQNVATTLGTWLDTGTVNGMAWTLATNMANTLPSVGGVNQVVLGACFKSAVATTADFGANGWNLLKWQTPTTWGSGAFDVGGTSCYQPNGAQYPQDLTIGTGNNNVAALNNRSLYFYVKAPAAVTDTKYHRFTVTITAAVGL